MIYHDILLEYLKCRFKRHKLNAQNNVVRNHEIFNELRVVKIATRGKREFQPFSVFGT